MNCLKCGCEITSRTAKKFCGRSCAAAYNNKKFVKRKRSPYKKCPVCNEVFPERRKYCSDECRTEGVRSKNNILVGEVKRCNACKEIKDIGLFGINRKTPDGLMRQCKDCNNSRVNTYNQKNKIRARGTYERYGLTKEDFEAMVEAQGGMCDICKIPLVELQSKHVHIDHDHDCCPEGSCGGCIRGILCNNCNRGLGGFGDNLDSLTEAVLYLQKYNQARR